MKFDKSIGIFLVFLTGLFMCSLMQGCVTFDEYSDEIKPFVIVGTVKAIEKGQTVEERKLRAGVALEFVGKAKSWFDVEKLTLDQLQERLAAEVTQSDWEISDKIIVNELIFYVISELRTRVNLPEQELRYQVNQVLEWVEYSAKLFE